MEAAKAMDRFERLAEASKVGILTTIDAEGYPRSRWMTPTLLAGSKGRVYAVSSPDSGKVAQIRANPKVQWFFQSKVLDEVASASGLASLVDDPAFKARVLEAIGPNLQIFWRTNPDARKLVVVETVVKEVSVFSALTGERLRAALE